MKKIEKGALTLTTDAVRATEILRAAIRATGATTRRAEAVAAIFWCNGESGGLGSVRSRNGGGLDAEDASDGGSRTNGCHTKQVVVAPQPCEGVFRVQCYL